MTSKGILWAVLSSGSLSRPSLEPIHPVTPHIHLTLVYGVERAMVAHLEGRQLGVTSSEIVTDDRIQLVTWQKLPLWVPCQNRYPHTTISHTPDVEPAYSNVLLALKTGERKQSRFFATMQIEFHAWEDPQ